MTAALWSIDALCKAAGGVRDGASDIAINGVSIDTRTLEAGDLFVALVDQRDGHDFVSAAFAHGAGAALVRTDYVRGDGDGMLIRVPDPLRALEAIGREARARLHERARVFAVTGSAGKTGTKEMLRACLNRLGKTHASEKSYNNHWGVPLTLARMPADTDFAVFEIGMNHAGEIRPLSLMVRPHGAIITTVEAVHIENFASVEAIADAKAEIFQGLMAGGPALIKADNPHAARLTDRAYAAGSRPLTFAVTSPADVSATDVVEGPLATTMTVVTPRARYPVTLTIPGRHIAENAVAVVGAMYALGLDVTRAASALADIAAPVGRGQRTLLDVGEGRALLIDESYNANPASMRAALATLSRVPRTEFPRRVIVLGDMLELGPEAQRLHTTLKEPILAAGIDAVFACGPLSRGLFDALPQGLKAGYAETATALIEPLAAFVGHGDVVMLKASNGTRVGVLVDALKSKFGPTG